MATTAQAIDRIAAALMELPATAFRGARVMRETDHDLWPEGSQGRGMEAHVEPRHLTNLTLALTLARPITSAPKIVPIYRALVASDLRLIEREVTANGLLTREVQGADLSSGLVWNALRRFSNTLGTLLDGLIITVQRPDNQLLRQLLRGGAFEVSLTKGPIPQAVVSITGRWAGETNETTQVILYRLAPGTLLIPDTVPDTVPTEVVTVRFTLFEVLANLWGDTLDHRARKAARQARTKKPTPPRSASDDAPTDANTKTENAEGTLAPSAPSDRSPSLDPRQGTEGPSRQGPTRGRIATGLLGRFDPILVEREGQERSPCNQGDMFGGHRSQTRAHRLRRPLHGPQPHSAGSALA